MRGGASSFADDFLVSNLQATDLAFYLIEQGKAVSIVTPDTADLVSKGQANWVKQLSTPMLYARGTRLWPQAEVTSVGDGEVTVRMVSGATTTYPCDTVIEAFGMVPNKGMLDELPIPASTCTQSATATTPGTSNTPSEPATTRPASCSG